MPLVVQSRTRNHSTHEIVLPYRLEVPDTIYSNHDLAIAVAVHIATVVTAIAAG